MKKLYALFPLATFATAAFVSLPAHAQETREQAVAALRTPEPKEMDPTFTKPAPFAQKLVDQALAKHPEVLLLAIHAGAPKYDIIASNFGRYGKLGDEDDLRCIHTGKDNLEQKGIHYEDQVVLRDKSGKVVGAIGTVFGYKPGDDLKAKQKIAHEIEKEMQDQISSSKALFGPA